MEYLLRKFVGMVIDYKENNSHKNKYNVIIIELIFSYYYKYLLTGHINYPKP